MSHQNLLELDDFNHHLTTAEKDTVNRPQPKPRPRTSKGNLFSKENDVDDVISISSNGSPANKEQGNSHSNKYGRSSTGSAFDNPAFLTEDETPTSEGSPTGYPHQKQRPGFIGSPSSSRPGKQYDRQMSSESSNGESDRGSKVAKFFFDDDNRNETFQKTNKERPGTSSIFTMENELSRYHDNSRLEKKPPKPKPRPRPNKKSSTHEKNQEELVQRENISETEQSDDNHLSDSTHSVKEDSPPNPKKRSDYLAVPIELSVDVGANEGKMSAADAAETISISSSATTNTKETVKKSRFSKLFNSSSAGEKKNGETPAEKSSFVNRWRQTAQTFLKAKSIEENETLEEVVNEDETKVKNPSLHETPRKRKETRIIIPEPESSSEEEDIDDKFRTLGQELQSKPDRKTRSAQQTSGHETESKTNVAEDETTPGKKFKFKPLSQLLRTKSKETLEKLKLTKQADDDALNVADSNVQSKPETKPKRWKEIVEKVHKRDTRGKSSESSKQLDVELSSGEEDSQTEIDSDDAEQPESIKSKSPLPRRKQLKPPETVQLTDSSGNNLLFGITIHSSDLLPLDPNVIHPVVKVTVMFQDGSYIKRSDIKAETRKKSEKKSRHKKDNIEESSSNMTTSIMTESILPIMSQPCQARHSIPTFAPTWNELLVFEEPFRTFAVFEPSRGDKEPIILFEIMDFLPMNTDGNSSSVSGFHGSEPGWYKVAWAFLKPLAGNKAVNLNKKLRLQLYKPIKLRSKNQLPGPEVFSWWKSGKREKVKSTLYITPKGIIPPETKTASLRQLLSMRKEHLTQAILDSQLATKKKMEFSRQPSLFELRELASWTRMEGQSCKAPNKLVTSLPSSQIESLNIVISGNVHCLKFSPCGTKLAAGLDTDELHVILMFEIPSWTLQKSLKGHHGIIYEITWKIFELDDNTSYHYLASASADSTVRIWRMQNNDERTMTLINVLYHPSFVYCVKFHPTHPGIIATGCFDYVIRIWDMKPIHGDERKKKSKKKDKLNDMSPIILLDKHNSFVNCLLFDHGGHTLFSGDGCSCLFKWTIASPSQKRSWKLEKDAKLQQENVPVNSIDLHPSGNRLLVHLRDSTIKILDVVTFIPLQSFPGLKNERFQIRSCFSPCGNLVLSGSEDSTLCIWDSDTGKIVQFTTPNNHPQCLVSCVDYHPFDYYVAIGLASTISEPSPILIYFYEQSKFLNYPLLKRTAQKMRESLEKRRSQSTESVEEEGGHRRNRDSHLSSATRGNSSEKFVSIIQKLDTALYFAQQRNKTRNSEIPSSVCANSTIIARNGTEQSAEYSARKIQNQDDDQEPMVNNSENESKKVKIHYIRKSRPRSASSSTKERRERYRQEHRVVQSDSEQTYQLKLNSSTNKYANANDENTSGFSNNSPPQKMHAVRTLSSENENRKSVESIRPQPLRRMKGIINTSSSGTQNNNTSNE